MNDQLKALIESGACVGMPTKCSLCGEPVTAAADVLCPEVDSRRLLKFVAHDRCADLRRLRNRADEYMRNAMGLLTNAYQRNMVSEELLHSITLRVNAILAATLTDVTRLTRHKFPEIDPAVAPRMTRELDRWWKHWASWRDEIFRQVKPTPRAEQPELAPIDDEPL